MNRLRFYALLSLALVESQVLPGQTITLLNETFADGDRTTQNPPASLAWYAPGAAVSTIGFRGQALVLVANNDDRLIWGYLPAVTLARHESLTLTIDFSFNRVAPASTGAFKVALCSTAGLAPKRADGGPPTGGYQGYATFTNPGDGTGGTRLRKRSGAGSGNNTATILELTDGTTEMVWTTFGASRTGLSGILQANTPYRKILRITRTGADTVDVTTSISGGNLAPVNTVSETDAANIVTVFDTIAIGAAETVQAGDLSITRVQVVHEANSTRLTNLSVLSAIESNGDAFTLGYVVGGGGTSGSKPLVIRAAGPSLGALGVPGTLDDPRLELFKGAAKTLDNDNWGGTATLSTAMAQVGAFAYASPGSRDAAIATDIGIGDNSVRISAADNGTGAVIAEIYDATPGTNFSNTTPRLVNVSVLKPLGAGLTVGFVVGGEGRKTVLVRVVGPTLGAAPFGISGVDSDPRVELYRGQERIAQNDNWGGAQPLVSAFATVAAFPLGAGSRDAALVATLEPGNYSVEVKGATTPGGIALVEVYEIP
jgi:hypothetical protein